MWVDKLEKLILQTPPDVLSRRFLKIPRRLYDWKRKAAFQNTVRFAYQNSSFYRKKFDDLHINLDKVKTPQDLGDFYTMPEDIVSHAEEFRCQKPHIVFESSGTTGRNKRIYYTQEELDSIGFFNAAGLFLEGLRRKDRVINGFDFNIWIPGMVAQKSLEKARVFCMAAGKVDPMEVYRRIPTYGFNVVMGEPTWLIKLTEIAERHGSYPLKLIVGGAEAMPQAARPWMTKVWQGAKVSMAYACVESGLAIGFEPSFDICGGYHINENGFWVEIFQPDANGYGEIAFTTLTRKTMPLIRYRNRDITSIVETPCPCGTVYRRLGNFHGRADEMVVASGGNLYPLMFENILKDVENITEDWQIVFKLSGIHEILEFHLETANKTAAFKKAVQNKIIENIQSLYPDLWKNYCLGIFQIGFVYNTPASLRNGRKLIRVLDKRNEPACACP